jgi:hypothetical protein
VFGSFSFPTNTYECDVPLTNNQPVMMTFAVTHTQRGAFVNTADASFYGVTATASAPITVVTPVNPPARIAVSTTVGLDAATCAPSNWMRAPIGTEITFCYRVTNVGSVHFRAHYLTDTVFGVPTESGYLFQTDTYPDTTGGTQYLDPGESAFFTRTWTVSGPITESVYWLAGNTDAYMATEGGNFANANLQAEGMSEAMIEIGDLATPTPLPTATATPTVTPSPTAIPTETPIPSVTSTETPAPTSTPTPSATNTPEPTGTSTPTPAVSATVDPTSSATATHTPESSATPTLAPTATAEASPTPTETATPGPALTSTVTQTPESTPIETSTPAPTETPTPVATATPSLPPTPVALPTPIGVSIRLRADAPSANASALPHPIHRNQSPAGVLTVQIPLQNIGDVTLHDLYVDVRELRGAGPAPEHWLLSADGGPSLAVARQTGPAGALAPGARALLTFDIGLTNREPVRLRADVYARVGASGALSESGSQMLALVGRMSYAIDPQTGAITLIEGPRRVFAPITMR